MSLLGLEHKDVRIGAYNWLVVGLLAVTFIVTLKLVVSKVYIPGLTEAAHSV